MGSVLFESTFPWRLRGGLNRRGGWRARAAPFKRDRMAVSVACFAGLSRYAFLRGPDQDDSARTVTLVRGWAKGERALDDDNLRGAFKGVRDEVADILGIHDNDPRVAWRYEQRKSADGKHAVTVRLETRQPGACPTCGHAPAPRDPEPPLEAPDGTLTRAPRSLDELCREIDRAGVRLRLDPEKLERTGKRARADADRLRALATSASRPAPAGPPSVNRSQAPKRVVVRCSRGCGRELLFNGERERGLCNDCHAEEVKP